MFGFCMIQEIIFVAEIHFTDFASHTTFFCPRWFHMPPLEMPGEWSRCLVLPGSLCHGQSRVSNTRKTGQWSLTRGSIWTDLMALQSLATSSFSCEMPCFSVGIIAASRFLEWRGRSGAPSSTSQKATIALIATNPTLNLSFDCGSQGS